MPDRTTRIVLLREQEDAKAFASNLERLTATAADPSFRDPLRGRRDVTLSAEGQYVLVALSDRETRVLARHPGVEAILDRLAHEGRAASGPVGDYANAFSNSTKSRAHARSAWASL